MIRFAPQAAAKPLVAPQAAARPMAASEPATDAGPPVGLLLADLDSASAATPAKPSKPRAAKKQKAAADSTPVQLDLDA